ncbi:MAG: MaoC family dehydratase [Candidatus Bathyarchaeia archaeon]
MTIPDQVRIGNRIKAGDVAVLKRAFSVSEVVEFARLSGDENPIHVDEAYALRSRFGKCIVHGLLTSSLISTVLGTKLPGPGSIYLKQTLEFTAPVFIGEEVTCNVRVKQIRGHLIELETQCSKPDGTVAVKGSALVLCEE